jgi:hypothetical protein
VDLACTPCPGSSVYVYEHVNGQYVCDWCSLRSDDEDATFPTEDAMVEHLRAHVAAGNHVRRSLLLSDEERLADERRFCEQLRSDPSGTIAKACVQLRPRRSLFELIARSKP